MPEKILTAMLMHALAEQERKEFYLMPKLYDHHPRNMHFAQFGEQEWNDVGRPTGKRAFDWAKKFWQNAHWKNQPTQAKEAKRVDPENARDGIVS
jgi:hypothetical protein